MATTTAIDVADARNVYLHVYDSFATDVAEIASSVKGVNTKYARQILKDLQSKNLVHFSSGDSGEFEDCWQPVQTHDEINRTEAEHLFDTTYGSETDMTTTATPAPTKPKAEPKPCLCGCGEQVPGKSFYRPGHDARHAGMVGKEIAANYTEKGFDRRTLLDALPSDALKAKAEGIAEKQIAKAEAKIAREDARAKAKAEKDANHTEEGMVKVGKKEFAATRDTRTGEVVYYDGDEVKAASATATKTFVAG